MGLLKGAKKAETLGKVPKKKKESVVLTFSKDLETHAAFAWLAKAVKGFEAFYKEKVNKEALATFFIPEGMEHTKRPDNIKGEHGLATSSLQLKIRGENQPLTDVEVILLEKAKISTKKVELRAAIPERYFINEELVNDPAVVKALEDALTNSKKLRAALAEKGKTVEDLLGLQAAEPATEKTVVAEEALDQVFSLKDPKMVESLLPIVSIQSITPTFAEEIKDFSQILDIIAAAGVDLKEIKLDK